MLSNSLSFILSAFAFIVLATPLLGVTLHSPAGYLLILCFSMVIGILEYTFKPALQRIYIGITRNIFFVILALWYSIGVIFNILIRGNGLADWTLMITPISLIISIFFAFAFMNYPDCWRKLQIALIITWGIQSIFTIPKLYLDPSLARAMWFELSGSWIYGSQGYFALSVILLPILFWRSFKETGLLRIILVICCVLILIAASISSFGTPLGLLVVECLLTLTLTIFLMGKRRGWLITLILLVFFYIGFRFISTKPIFSEAFTRIENFINDPTSGGYSGKDLAVSRWYLDSISLQSFLENPFFGLGGGSTRSSPFVGGHSSFLDTLGAYGMLGGGGAFTCLMLLLMFNVILRFLHERTWENIAAVSTVAALIIAGIVNPYWEGSQPLLVILLTRPFIFDEKVITPINQTAESKIFLPFRMQQ